MEPDVVRWDSAQLRAAARLRELVDRRGRPVRRHRGVYLYGRPGRGKTMLLNRFFAAVATERKRRYHFHQFFTGLHAAAHESGSIMPPWTRCSVTPGWCASTSSTCTTSATRC
ncbi:AFG1/ZapE family ATPase [Nocardia asiatica]|uniref:AFG1/ZapE family ATPase n=1 Tax=Nocardia asiatica TaxID=209252 RepID=UPI003EE02E52